MKAKQDFRALDAAWRTMGYEAMHMIHKGQARWVSDDVRQQNRFIDQLLNWRPEISLWSIDPRASFFGIFQTCNTSR